MAAIQTLAATSVPFWLILTVVHTHVVHSHIKEKEK